MNNTLEKFLITDKVCVITGGAGLMGYNHACAVLAGGGVLIDIDKEKIRKAKIGLEKKFENQTIETYQIDITCDKQLEDVKVELVKKYGHIDILINNAANNPKMEEITFNMGSVKFGNFPLSIWNEDILVGLTGAFLCTKIFGSQMEVQRGGVILNVSSDLGIIAPDQRIYQKEGIEESIQTIKPVTYSVIKHGLIGLTKYTATYWAEKGIRCNAICPAGIENGQSEEFINKLTNLIPMKRMAVKDEYQSTVLYMISDASSYMTGATVIVDGGRTCW